MQSENELTFTRLSKERKDLQQKIDAFYSELDNAIGNFDDIIQNDPVKGADKAISFFDVKILIASKVNLSATPSANILFYQTKEDLGKEVDYQPLFCLTIDKLGNIKSECGGMPTIFNDFSFIKEHLLVAVNLAAQS